MITPVTLPLPGFAELCAASQTEGFAMLMRLEQHWQDGSNRFNKPGEILLAAWSGNELAGIGGLNRCPFDTHPQAARLRHLYISQAFRRQKVGLALVNALEAHAKLAGFHHLNTHAPETAFAFYQSLGFLPVTGQERLTHQKHLTPATHHNWQQ
ncbi:GNAT family N-acetyltransferase [Mangrovibacter plantisponsor]|uniref:Acetyltransferase (GNAT) family protein n=1 Tax=Mangrovibacter plantisponsor TaxID=451513 RepID=A0A317PR87_9ENTR|nr:GNAT family N-acetyltransferase [Mangrovibacter plantisponsor]PWW03058.1 acetyltransferase (GNAT) family protein [Mangrovibacter plantisponsor]